MTTRDQWDSTIKSAEGPLTRFRAISASASELEFVPRAFGVGTDGTVTIEGADGNSIDIEAKAGVVYPFRPNKITAFGGSGLWIAD